MWVRRPPHPSSLHASASPVSHRPRAILASHNVKRVNHLSILGSYCREYQIAWADCTIGVLITLLIARIDIRDPFLLDTEEPLINS